METLTGIRALSKKIARILRKTHLPSHRITLKTQQNQSKNTRKLSKLEKNSPNEEKVKEKKHQRTAR